MYFIVFRTKADGGDTQLPMAPHDAELFPQFKPTVTSADVTARASARTYFYATEQKCDDVMKNFLACVNMTGMDIFSNYVNTCIY